MPTPLNQSVSLASHRCSHCKESSGSSRYYHDDQIFSRHYEGITAHLDSLIEMARGALLEGGPNDPHPGPHTLDGLLAFGPCESASLSVSVSLCLCVAVSLTWRRGTDSDWCPARGCIECADPRKDASAYNSALVSSYYLIKQLRIVAAYSQLLAHADDAVRYSILAANMSAKFQQHFYDGKAKTFRESRNCACPAQ